MSIIMSVSENNGRLITAPDQNINDRFFRIDSLGYIRSHGQLMQGIDRKYCGKSQF